jgi:hypothetical protein
LMGIQGEFVWRKKGRSTWRFQWTTKDFQDFHQHHSRTNPTHPT